MFDFFDTNSFFFNNNNPPENNIRDRVYGAQYPPIETPIEPRVVIDRKLPENDDKILNAFNNLPELQGIIWNGLPRSMRAFVWERVIIGKNSRKLLEDYQHLKSLINIDSNNNIMKQILLDLNRIHLKKNDRPIVSNCSFCLNRVNNSVLCEFCEPFNFNAFLRHCKIQKILANILYIWAEKNPSCGYVQGMADILFPILIVLVCADPVFTAREQLAKKKHDKSTKTDKSIHNSGDSSFLLDDNPQDTNILEPTVINNPPMGSNNIMDNNNLADGIYENNNLADGIYENNNLADLSEKNHPSDNHTNNIDISTMSSKEFINQILDSTPTSILDVVESRGYFMFDFFLSSIHDFYTPNQRGIQEDICLMEKILKRIDYDCWDKLINHHEISLIQICFRWYNCLLVREFPIDSIIRLYDTYIAESMVELKESPKLNLGSLGDDGFLTPVRPQWSHRMFRDFHMYVCVVLLLKFKQQILILDYQNLIMCLQNLPTESWRVDDMNSLLSEAYVLKTLLKDSKHI